MVCVSRGCILGINGTIGSGHQSPGLWVHPEDESYRFNDVNHWTELAQMLEAAKFHGIFIADVLGTLSLSLSSLSMYVYF